MTTALQLDQSFSADVLSLLQDMGRIAGDHGIHLYLVGGAARNYFIKQPAMDLDLTSEMPAQQLAELFTHKLGGQVVQRSQFQTVRIIIAGKAMDLATTRSERYLRPGVLPQIQLDTLLPDLYRRDFTINALAISLHPSDWGEYQDPTAGLVDIQKMRIRILHENSFRDDATRILRSIRYESRLGFHLARKTLLCLKRDLHYLDSISPSRLHHEFLHLLSEPTAYRALRRAQQLGILKTINPGLGNISFTRKLRTLLKSPYSPKFKLFALTYATSPNESITLSHRLLLNKKVSSQILQIQGLKQIEKHLGTSTLSPNDIVMAIDKYDRAAIGIVGLLSDYRIVRKRLAGYLNYWSQIKPHLTGADLIKIGVPKGPMMRLLLEQLRAGRLNGVIRTHKGEIDMIKFALAEMGNPSGIKPIRRNLRSAAASKKDID